MAVVAGASRLIAAHLGGTLLRPDGSGSSRTRRAPADLAGARRAELVFATWQARPAGPRTRPDSARTGAADGTDRRGTQHAAQLVRPPLAAARSAATR